MENKKMNRRAFFVLIFLTLLIFGIMFRLAWIQIFTTRTFSYKKVDLISRAVEQRREKIILDTGRGTIYDRNGTPLLGKEVTGLAIFPTAHAQLKKAGEIEKLTDILGVSKEALNEKLKKMKHADFWRDEKGKILPLDDAKIKKVTELNIVGLMALPVVERYEQDQIARQVIGYIGYKENTEKTTEKVGIAGLEESFQPFLNSIGEKSVSFFVDGRGGPLYGLNVKKQEQQDAFYPLSIKTTLDASMQKIAEDAFNASGIQEGAGVILDVSTRKVLAMVSRPEFTPENEETRKDALLLQKGLENHALNRMTPGSVFKIVVAAAALEEGIVKPQDHFLCKGKYGKYGFTCWKEGGHGDLTFE
ncbi:MAG TPA: penicillin-binding protein, partial [Paenibacillaceae bacterium]|nr:penicillin-binding protein [Paenibacillaceae bacterium]